MQNALKEYLIQKNIKYTDFSKTTRIGMSTMWRIFKGLPIRINTAKKIEKFTQGELTPAHFLVQYRTNEIDINWANKSPTIEK